MDFDQWLKDDVSPSWLISLVLPMAMLPMTCGPQRMTPAPAAANLVSRVNSARESSSAGPASKLMCELIHKYTAAMADMNEPAFGDWLEAQAPNAPVLIPCIERLQAVEAMGIPYRIRDNPVCERLDDRNGGQQQMCSENSSRAVAEYTLLENWQNVLRGYSSWDETDSGRNMAIMAALCIDPGMDPMCQQVRDMFRAGMSTECSTRCD